MVTAKKELEPVINVINKAMRNGAENDLVHLYNQGQQDYIQHRLTEWLTDEERAYIDSYVRNNKSVPILSYNSNYPLAFFTNHENEWQGIFFDVLQEVTRLTGLTFEIPHDENGRWLLNSGLLSDGSVSMTPELIPTVDLEDNYIWSDFVILTDYYALISRPDYRNLTLNEIRFEKIGLSKGTYFSEEFKRWFPQQKTITEYQGIDAAIDALGRGEVDLVMMTQRRLLYLTHFREMAGYKVNIMFKQPLETSFAYPKSETVLRSIIDKTLSLIDLDGITVRWTQRTYDYRSKVAEARLPWLLGAIGLSFVVIILVLSLFFKNSKEKKQLQIMIKKVNEASQFKSRFLARMSHEIRTPMNAILGAAEMQLYEEHSPAADEAFNIIYDSGSLLLNIINDILDLSKIEADKLEIVSYKYDIPSLINETVQLNRLRFESKPIEFKLVIDPKTPLNLFGDELRIKQILNNLISNAYKYTEKGTVELFVSFEDLPAPAQENTGMLVLRVSDTGQGMTEEQLEKLFGEYMRFNLDINRTVVGTGLGMNITKHFIEMMNGNISVESEAGKGSVFTVYLPQKRFSKQECGSELAGKLMNSHFHDFSKSRKTKIMREYMPYGSVLVVDDVESNLYVARSMMLPYGLKIETALSGQEAIDKIKNGSVYDVIFMDHMMPVMDGIETVKIIRDMGYNNIIIALTANAVTGQAEMFLANGFNGYVSKPIDTRELNSVLNVSIRDNQPPEVIEKARREKETKGGNFLQTNTKNEELKRLFTNDAEKVLGTLEEVFQKIKNAGQINADDKDLQLYIINVHGIKNALSNINEKELANTANELEQAGRDMNITAIINDTPSFLSALGSLIAKLKQEEESKRTDVPSAISEEDLKYLREKLTAIKTALSTLDKKTAKNELAEIKQKTWPRHIEEKLEIIADHLLHSAFEEAANTADSIIAGS
jgi:signal transduction histidine kinase/CheY-like chemotaxis protein